MLRHRQEPNWLLAALHPPIRVRHDRVSPLIDAAHGRPSPGTPSRFEDQFIQSEESREKQGNGWNVKQKRIQTGQKKSFMHCEPRDLRHRQTVDFDYQRKIR
jgi:outer membrane biogenesis lipoprotein LolB